MEHAIEILKSQLECAESARSNLASNLKMIERKLAVAKQDVVTNSTRIIELKRAIKKLGGRL